MHDVVVNELEERLAGGLSLALDGHLSSCGKCREEVESITRVSGLMAELRSDPETAPEVPPFFFSRVTSGIIEHQNTDHWGLLAPGAAFFRRVAFASLLLLAGLGSFLATRDGDVSGSDPVAIMAQHDVTAPHAESSDRDLMLVTLGSYGE